MINPTIIQSTKITHKKKVKNPKKDKFKARANRTLEPNKATANNTKKAGSSRAHWSLVPKLKMLKKKYKNSNFLTFSIHKIPIDFLWVNE